MRPNRVVIVDKHRCTFVAEIAVVGGPSQIADGLFFNVFARGVVHAGCENLKKCLIFNPPASEAIKGPFINYVTHLGGGGGKQSRYDLLRRGEGGWQLCYVTLRYM